MLQSAGDGQQQQPRSGDIEHRRSLFRRCGVDPILEQYGREGLEQHAFHVVIQISAREALTDRFGARHVSIANTRSALSGELPETLPFSCPFAATKSSKRRQWPAQSEGRKSHDLYE